ncbi:hypothetical protein Trydic_g20963 [Trypoxylus dichotomus]
MIKFLNAEGETPIDIHEKLRNVYGDAKVRRSNSTIGRWVRRCNRDEGQTLLAGEKRSGKLLTTVASRNIGGDCRQCNDDYSTTVLFTDLCKVGTKNVNRSE